MLEKFTSKKKVYVHDEVQVQVQAAHSVIDVTSEFCDRK